MRRVGGGLINIGQVTVPDALLFVPDPSISRLTQQQQPLNPVRPCPGQLKPITPLSNRSLLQTKNSRYLLIKLANHVEFQYFEFKQTDI